MIFAAPASPATQPALFAAPAGPAPTPFAPPPNSGRAPALAGQKPTAEQAAILDAFGTGQHVVAEAGAGTGKTFTLLMLATSAPHRRGLYLAYNKAIQTEAARKFPASVECRTAHSLAFRTVGQRYAHRLPGMSGAGNRSASTGRRLPAREVAEILGLGGARIGQRYLAGAALARLAEQTVTRFCQSADAEIGTEHLPHPPGLDAPQHRAELGAAVLPAARKLWADLCDVDGQLWFTHDHYLKLWALTGPRLHTDVIYADEWQDANPVIAAVVEAQQAQRVYVGDRSQAIYRWRGAIDAMADAPGVRLRLSQSFRFGEVIAAEANAWLRMLDADLRLSGRESIPSTLAHLPDARAVLCRTNAGAIGAVMQAFERGRQPHLVGGGGEAKRLAWAATSLMDGRGCDLPELAAFRTWKELTTYVDEEDSGRDLKVYVDLIHRYGARTIINTVERLVPETRADVVVSTAHKAKGLEWPEVRIGDDFAAPLDGDRPDRAELMLAYVAITRAQRRLDTGSLRWRHTGTVVEDGTWWSGTDHDVDNSIFEGDDL